MRSFALLAVAFAIAACSAERTKKKKRSEPDPDYAPLRCLREAKADHDIKLSHDQLVQLCSGATGSGPLHCYREAKRDRELDLSDLGALMLCSPFNLDAYNAKRNAADDPLPVSSTDMIARSKLEAIEAQLEAISKKLEK